MPNEFDESSYGYPNDGGSDINNTWQTEPNRAGQPQQDQVYYTRPQPGTQKPPYPPSGAPSYYPPPYPMYGMPPQKPKGSGAKIFVWCLCAAVVIIIAGVLIFVVSSGLSEGESENSEPSGSSKVESSYGEPSDITKAPDTNANPDGPQISAAETPEGQSENTKTATKVYDKAAKSIVCITSYDENGDYIRSAEGEGSGIIATEDGYIFTNSHVVDDSKKTGVMVTLTDNTQYLGTIIGIDVKTDIAVIKIDAHDLVPAEFADSDKLMVGQEAFAIGNPGGSAFSNSLTKGAISALDRILSGSGYIKYIQTDAAINPGNSGGALINEHGQVIGMNTAKLVATDYEGMGFAIPSNSVVEIANKIIKYGYVNDRGTLSIEGKTSTLYMSKTNNIPQGMMITKINKDSPLASTDAEVNDIITEINGQTIISSTELIDELKKYKPGDEVTLKLYRPVKNSKSKGYTFEVKIKLKADTGSE